MCGGSNGMEGGDGLSGGDSTSVSDFDRLVVVFDLSGSGDQARSPRSSYRGLG